MPQNRLFAFAFHTVLAAVVGAAACSSSDGSSPNEPASGGAAGASQGTAGVVDPSAGGSGSGGSAAGSMVNPSPGGSGSGDASSPNESDASLGTKDAGNSTDATVSVDAPSVDQILATGKFVNKNETGSGDVTIVHKANGTLVVHFANLQTNAGPDVYVYLTKNPSPGTQAEVEAGFVSLGPLKGTQGNFDYVIPVGTDLKAFPGVIIYCRQYHSTFCAATPK